MNKEYKGISWDRTKQRWKSKILHNGILYFCGFHIEQIDAVKARDRCIIKHGLGLEKLQIIKPKKNE